MAVDCARRFGLPLPSSSWWRRLTGPAVAWVGRKTTDHRALIGGVHFYWDEPRDSALPQMLADGVALLSRVDVGGWKRFGRFFRYAFLIHRDEIRMHSEAGLVIIGQGYVTEPVMAALVLRWAGIKAWHFCVGGMDGSERLRELSERLGRGRGLRFASDCLRLGEIDEAAFARARHWLMSPE